MQASRRHIFAILTATAIGMSFLSPISDASPSSGVSLEPSQWSDSPTTSMTDDVSEIVPYDFRESGAPGTCRLVVWDVGWDKSTNWLGIQGGRENCANNAEFFLELRKDIPRAPDPLIGSVRGVNNQIVRAFGACKGPGSYYGQVVSSTGNTLRGANSGACR